MKRLLFISLIMLSLSITACSSKTTKTQNTETNKTLTVAELKKFDGQNGNPAYVAVDGIVYDVTSSSSWTVGSHKGYKAGNDLTKEISSSPHGSGIMKKFPIVGKLVDK